MFEYQQELDEIDTALKKKLLQDNKYYLKSPRGKQIARAARKRTRLRNKFNAPEKLLFEGARRRAKENNLEFKLKITDIKIPEKCPILGLVLTPSFEQPSACSPSLDRINNTRGYVPDNIHVISYRANSLKRDATAEELRKLADYFETLDKKTIL